LSKTSTVSLDAAAEAQLQLSSDEVSKKKASSLILSGAQGDAAHLTLQTTVDAHHFLETKLKDRTSADTLKTLAQKHFKSSSYFNGPEVNAAVVVQLRKDPEEK